MGRTLLTSRLRWHSTVPPRPRPRPRPLTSPQSMASSVAVRQFMACERAFRSPGASQFERHNIAGAILSRHIAAEPEAAQRALLGHYALQTADVRAQRKTAVRNGQGVGRAMPCVQATSPCLGARSGENHRLNPTPFPWVQRFPKIAENTGCQNRVGRTPAGRSPWRRPSPRGQLRHVVRLHSATSAFTAVTSNTSYTISEELLDRTGGPCWSEGWCFVGQAARLMWGSGRGCQGGGGRAGISSNPVAC